MINIAEKEVLGAYLLQRGIVKEGEAYGIKYCKGGVSGTVAFVTRDGAPIIIKQALGQLKTKDTWFCDPNRMYTEYESNRIYHELMPENTPEVYFYDGENYIYGREAVPDGCPMWKENLMAGKLDFEVARKSILTLAKVHRVCSSRQDIKELFASKEIFYGLRISPYIEFTVQKYPELKAYADQIVDETMNESITLVHGDYSPKNIMVTEDGISVLDYEVAHCGHPAFDLAFFSNHFVLKSVKYNQYGEAYLAMLKYMVKLYFAHLDFMDRARFEASYIRILAMLMLARIDGKSPVEYLVEDGPRKQLVRDLSVSILKENICTFDAFFKKISEALAQFESRQEA